MVERNSKSRGLGRGLSALMSDVSTNSKENIESSQNPSTEKLVPVEKIYPNPNQPRKLFQEEKLIELAKSIKTKGIVQPLIVRKKKGTKESYEIVAGERRWRAAQRARIHELPVIVKEFTDIEVLEIAIIENVQRAELSSVKMVAGNVPAKFSYLFGIGMTALSCVIFSGLAIATQRMDSQSILNRALQREKNFAEHGVRLPDEYIKK